MASHYQYREKRLTEWGLLPFEAEEIARQYLMDDIRSVAYLEKIIRTRRLYVANMHKRQFTDNDIQVRIIDQYIKNKWVDNDGKPSVWEHIRAVRKKTIADGEYVIPERSKHKGGKLDREAIDRQRQRIRRKSELQKYEEGRGR